MVKTYVVFLGLDLIPNKNDGISPQLIVLSGRIYNKPRSPTDYLNQLYALNQGLGGTMTPYSPHFGD